MKSATPVIGMIVPPAAGEVPSEAYGVYPEGVRYVARGLALGKLTIDGYGAVIDRVEELSRELHEKEGADAIALMGTSLSFFRGSGFNEELVRVMKAATGLPATTMSNGIRDALRAVGAQRVAVGTAYTDEVNAQLRGFLEVSGFEVLSLESLGLVEVPEIHAVTEEQVVALGERAADRANGKADAVLISCGGLKSTNLAPELEPRVGVPVVASATAGVWAALRLVGINPATATLGALGRVAA